MRTERSFLLICAVAVAGCIGLAWSVVSLVADGGWHPERYTGGVDPIRAGMVVLFIAGGVLFALYLVGAVVGWREQPGLGPVAAGLATGGMVIACAAIVVLLISMPPSAGPIAMPPAIAAAVRIGGGLAIVGFVLGIFPSTRDRIRGRP
jgi:hypothetical protein